MAAAVDARAAAVDERAAAAALPFPDVAKPLSDPREYRALTLPSGLRLMVVRDADAEFAAAACSVQVGYFDDDDDLAGAAHALEHAVHLGSERFPTTEGGYKFFLGQHGGTSNASTGARVARIARTAAAGSRRRHAATPPRRHAATPPRRHAATPPRRHAATPPRRHAATPTPLSATTQRLRKLISRRHGAHDVPL
jgi:hypothetical protein